MRPPEKEPEGILKEMMLDGTVFKIGDVFCAKGVDGRTVSFGDDPEYVEWYLNKKPNVEDW